MAVAAISSVACRDDVAMAPASSAAELLAQIAAETSVQFPLTAHVVGFKRRERGAVSAKVVLNEQDWVAFLQTMPVDEEVMTPPTGGFLGADQGWWDPNAARSLRTGQIEREPLVLLNIGIDDSDPNAVVVYVNQF